MKHPLEMHFVYLGNKNIYSIFDMLHYHCFIFHQLPLISEVFLLLFK